MRRLTGALLVLALSVPGLAGCTSDGAGAPGAPTADAGTAGSGADGTTSTGGTETGSPVAPSTATGGRASSGASADPGATGGGGTLAAKDWPDACTLSRPAEGRPGDPRPEASTLPESGERVPSQRCRWTLDQGRTLTLAVLSVTDDVLDAWSAYRFTAGTFREVTNLGDEAFLTSGGTDDDVLYVCKGHTIFTVAATGTARPEDLHPLLLDVAGAAVGRLAGSAAGAPVA